MGTVWHARDEVLGRDVAVKEVILPHGFSDEEREIQHKRTFREARTAARLGHPGVVTVYDVVEEDGRPWIVMELIRGRSLQDHIKKEGVLAPRLVAEIGRQMLGALSAAHEAGILHRDVKPSNVLVTEARSKRAVLTDFGIARAQSDATLTQTGMLIGSPAYIAPERARGRVAVPASDLWSLGVTLYAAVEGKSPFERPDAMASLVAVLTDEPARASNAGPLLPVILGLLRKDPDKRLTVGEAAAMIDQILLAGFDGAVTPDGPTRPLSPSEIQNTGPSEPDEEEQPSPAAAMVTMPDDVGENTDSGYRVGPLAIGAALLIAIVGIIMFTTLR